MCPSGLRKVNTVWSALPQSPGTLCSCQRSRAAPTAIRSTTVRQPLCSTCRDRWPASICRVRPTALEPVAGCYTSYLYRHTGLLQTSTEGVPVSLSGRHVADYSTSAEELTDRDGTIRRRISTHHITPHLSTVAHALPVRQRLKTFLFRRSWLLALT